MVSGCSDPTTAFPRKRYTYIRALSSICTGYTVQLTWKLVKSAKSPLDEANPTPCAAGAALLFYF